MGRDSRTRGVWGPAGLLSAAGWCAAVASVFFYVDSRMVLAAATGALFVAFTIISQLIARSRRQRERPVPAGPASEGPGAPGLGLGGRKALSRNRAELVHVLLGAAGSVCGLAAVALFVAWDQVFWGMLVGVAGFALAGVRQKILEHSRLQEGIDAKAEWDREHAADVPETGLRSPTENP